MIDECGHRHVEAIAHLGDPLWGYCYECKWLLHREDETSDDWTPVLRPGRVAALVAALRAEDYIDLGNHPGEDEMYDALAIRIDHRLSESEF